MESGKWVGVGTSLKYEGTGYCQDESTGVKGRVVTRYDRVISRVPVRNQRRLLISVYCCGPPILLCRFYCAVQHMDERSKMK